LKKKVRLPAKEYESGRQVGRHLMERKEQKRVVAEAGIFSRCGKFIKVKHV
jgi:hypothetical protein